MPELSVELEQWEAKAFERKRKPASLSIEVDGEAVVITGPAKIIQRAIDLGFCHYVQFDGFIRAAFDDPIPHNARQRVNALISKLWRKPK